MQGSEDPTHFMATCPALERKRKELLENLPPTLKSLALIPDPAHDPIEFLLGIPWIEENALQEFSINFITELKAIQAEILLNNP